MASKSHTPTASRQASSNAYGAGVAKVAPKQAPATLSLKERQRRVNAIASRHGAHSAEAHRAAKRLHVQSWETQPRATKSGRWVVAGGEV